MRTTSRGNSLLVRGINFLQKTLAKPGYPCLTLRYYYKPLLRGDIVMKKKITIVSQPEKTDTTNPELLSNQLHQPKMYRDHKVCDHYTHGRANKFPFGSSHGPLFF